MASSYPVILILIVILALNAVAFFLTPKGPQQTVIRTGLMLALTACYLLWAITYLAQVHPLIAPRRSAVEE